MAESARKEQRLSPGISATPNATAQTEPITPFRRAISAGPTPTFRTPALARDTRPIEPEPQTLPRKSRHSALDLPDVVDSPDVAVPRLSMPLEDMYDDDSFHERPPRQSLLPELLDDVDGATVQSLEFGRRALSEDPRYSRRVSERFADLSELGAGGNDEFEIDGSFIHRRRTGAFDLQFDQTIVEEDEDTVQALTGRREGDGPSSDADLGVFGQQDDMEEPTFRFHIPDRIRVPRTQEEELEDATAAFLNFPEDEEGYEEVQETEDPEVEQEELPLPEQQDPEDEEEEEQEDEEEETALHLESDPPPPIAPIGWEPSSPGHLPDDPELAAYREEESALDRSLRTPEPPSTTQKRLGGTRRKETKLSRVGLDYPSFPAATVKKLALSFMKSQGSKAQLNKDAVATLVQTTDDFFEQMGVDLAAYAQHAGRRGIEEADVLALMRRTRKTSSNASSFSLAQKMLPRELLQQLRMEPRPKVKGQKRKRLATVVEEE
ncbi:hypothetical protein G6514_004759 [Epicoccum nigrum]|nr:hypothetical protein G6514_004759 [Epicoccum nigrum]